MKDNTRPINVGISDLLGFAWPIPALVSITHRIAGVVLFVGVGFGLFALDLSLSSEADFDRLSSMMTSPLGKFITWGLLAGLAYHFVAGIKHLLMDMGVGETLEGAKFGAQLTIFFSAILMVLAAIWIV